MMTYRERRLAKAERLRGWAGKRRTNGQARVANAKRIADFIPFGQPILVGHHSEKRHRRDLERINNGFDRGYADINKASEMESRADSIERAADNAIYDDDPDAIQRLEEKIAGLEAQREKYKAYNKTHVTVDDVGTPYRNRWNGAPVAEIIGKGKGTLAVRYKDGSEETVDRKRCNPALLPYVFTNLSGNINRLKKRMEGLKRERQFIAARPEREAGGATIAPAGWAGWVDVTFPTKPARDVLDELTAAGFRWVGKLQCWRGEDNRLPQRYKDAA